MIKHSIESYDAKEGLKVCWADMPCGSEGDAAGGAYVTAVVMALGCFGEGGSVLLECSRDEKEWIPLRIPALTTWGMFEIPGPASEPKFIRPRVTAGDHNTRITVTAHLATEDASALR